MPEAMTVEKTFPVLGSYQLTTADGQPGSPVTITLDSANKGMVWVEGLPQGRFKAYLSQSPGTYRILSQQSVSGTKVSEGTLHFDPSTNQLHVAIGKAYDKTNPTAIFNLVTDAAAVAEIPSGTEVKVKSKKGGEKSKAKVTFYTAQKSVENTTSTTNPTTINSTSTNNAFDQKLQQQQKQQEQQPQPQKQQ
jgi:hypothetical protein